MTHIKQLTHYVQAIQKDYTDVPLAIIESRYITLQKELG